MNEVTEEQSGQEMHEAITARGMREKVFSQGELRVHLVPRETVTMQESAKAQAKQELKHYQDGCDSGTYDHLSRYHLLMGVGLRDIDLSYGEAALIVDCLNGALMRAHVTFLPAQVSDAIAYDNLAEKWSIDGEALLAKLRQASPLALCAIIDAAERFWENTETYPADEPHELSLKRVGLIR